MTDAELDIDAGLAERLLATRTVQIKLGDRLVGTGFFAAPGTVVTCEHVLEAGKRSSGDPVIEVVGPQKRGYDLGDIADSSSRLGRPEDDLTVLRVKGRDDEYGPQHPCVLLGRDLRVNDRLIAFGYAADGSPRLLDQLRVTALIQNEGVACLEGGEAAAGMSGSPVLNTRTGYVCGVLRRHLDPDSDMAVTQAVRATVLFALSDKLPQKNRQFHDLDDGPDSWYRLVPSTSHPETIDAPVPKPRSTIIITLHRKETVESSGVFDWEVSATIDPPDPPRQIGPYTVNLNSVRLKVARIFRDWAAREAAAASRVKRDEQVRLLGEILSKAVLASDLEEEVKAQIAESDEGWVEVAVRFEYQIGPDVTNLVFLPWEHLCVTSGNPSNDVFVARHPSLSFVRTIAANQKPPKRTAPAPAPAHGGTMQSTLSVLLVGARQSMPEDTAKREQPDDVKLEACVDEVVQSTRALPSSISGLNIETLDTPDAGLLMTTIEKGDFDVVHYVGYGQLSVRDEDRIGLRLPDEVAFVTAEAFADSLLGRPSLVILQLCEREHEHVPPDLTEFAPRLLQSGISAVIAHQYPMSSRTSAPYIEALYTKLTEGMPVDVALQSARGKLWMADRVSHSFVSPALFVNRLGGTVVSTMRPSPPRPGQTIPYV